MCSLPFSTSPDPVEAAAGTPCPGTTSEGDAAVGIAPFIDVERAESAVFLALRRLFVQLLQSVAFLRNKTFSLVSVSVHKMLSETHTVP